MRMLTSTRVHQVVGGAAVLALAFGGVAVAAGAADRTQDRAAVKRTTITVCVGAKRDHLRLVAPGTKRCGKGERLMSWKTAGSPGKRGARGATGARGAAGASAYELAVSYGFGGTETDWLTSLRGANGAAGANGADGANGAPGVNGTDGADGPSAYDLAVADGFTGTRTAWLASLKGEPGETGEPGAAGPEGPAGPGLSAGSFYKEEFQVPLTSTSVGVTMGCDDGDIALTGWHSFAGTASLIHTKPQGTREWTFGIEGPTTNNDSVGVWCMDITP